MSPAAPPGFTDPMPRVEARRCTRCGAVDLTTFLPMHQGGVGIRLCAPCLALVDRRRVEVVHRV
jgi:hypothetical protein